MQHELNRLWKSASVVSVFMRGLVLSFSSGRDGKQRTASKVKFARLNSQPVGGRG